MKETFKIQVSGGSLRLDAYLAETLKETRMFIKNQILSGNIRVNDQVQKRPSHKVSEGDTVEGTLESAPLPDLSPVDGNLEVLHEDEHLLVVNKAQGVVVHPATGHRGETLVHYLLHHLQTHRPFQEFEPERPGIVHRLDRGTSGVILVAKDRHTHEALSHAFKERTVKKQYAAIVWGTPTLEGQVDTPIGRDIRNRKKMSSRTHDGRPSLTHWKTQKRFQHFTHLHLFPHTGRTHQLRVHLSEQGYPIVGDPMYGGQKRLSQFKHLDPHLAEQLESQTDTLLHAESVEFAHPNDGVKMRFSAPLPKHFTDFLEGLQQYDVIEDEL